MLIEDVSMSAVKMAIFFMMLRFMMFWFASLCSEFNHKTQASEAALNLLHQW
jgi:hypothetical protein